MEGKNGSICIYIFSGPTQNTAEAAACLHQIAVLEAVGPKARGPHIEDLEDVQRREGLTSKI